MPSSPEDRVQAAMKKVQDEINIYQLRQNKAVDDLRSMDQHNRETFESQTEEWKEARGGQEFRRQWRLEIQHYEDVISACQIRLFALNHEMACLEMEFRQI
jgi:hypothetical protein